jgi:hypothetical protein
MTDTAATAPEKTPEQKANTHAIRAIARAFSKFEEGSPEEVKARWTENKGTYTSQARKIVRALGRDGITLQLDETQTRKAKRSAGKKDAADTAE